MLYGDNGTGKSSFLDAIEFITQGTVHNMRDKKYGSWIYNSKSKVNLSSETKIFCDFDNDEKVSKNCLLNDGKLKIITLQNGIKNNKNVSIPEFCHAPLVLRRRDIIKFWNLDSVERLKVFIPFSNKKNYIGYIPLTEQERLGKLRSKRLRLKKKRNKRLFYVCKHYGFNYKDEKLKVTDNLVSKINEQENIKQLLDLKKKNIKKYREIKILCNLYRRIKNCNNKIKQIENKYKRIMEESNDKFQGLKKIMNDISPEITNIFKKISPSRKSVEKITVYVATQTSISLKFKLTLSNGSTADPEKYFSEGNLDLLALILYFEFIYKKQFDGQSKVLVIDDIFQSIDSNIRFKFFRYLIKRFSDWQFIITTHDKLWKEDLINLFINHNKQLIKYEIENWNLLDGPHISSGINNYDEKLKETINTGDAHDICSRAGYMLEYLCDNLSKIIHSGVERKKDDKYTIGDLWKGILKKMKKTPAKETYENLDDFIFSRNIAGAHYNKYAVDFPKDDAKEFASLVIDAYYEVFYKSKGKWISSIKEVTGEKL
ncbi:AAA family ATPase [Fructilactobacillus myrtifloralis]|uniref:AAA family ATPase n=1 Tax=Fructilactobacillus myrtifloralis TaxID=2940301 RepID=A0ABY5BRA8_9LACO|nr:AAA family ATPase [Fructilactobacillus myrtifloralis]